MAKAINFSKYLTKIKRNSVVWTKNDWFNHYTIRSREVDKIAFPFECMELIPEFYELSKNSFINETKKIIGNGIFYLNETIKDFIDVQKLLMNDCISKNSTMINEHPRIASIYTKQNVCYKNYLSFLNSKENDLDNNNINKNEKIIFQTIEEQSKEIDQVKLDFISFLAIQLTLIERNLKDEIEENLLVYNYFVCETKNLFLDEFGLQKYLTETDIKNIFFLKTLCLQCYNIILLYNENFGKTPLKEFEETFFWENIDGKSFGYATNYFHAIDISNNRISNFSTRHGQEQFLKNYKFKNYSLWTIAEKCSLIIDLLITSNKEIETVFNKESKNSKLSGDSIFNKTTSIDNFKSYVKLQITEFSFKNNFDNVNNNDVYRYFKSELVDKNYLEIATLYDYLDLAFDKKQVPTEKFSFQKMKTLKSVRQIFYKYYSEIEIGRAHV